MALKSMTGFSRIESEADGTALSWELKSVNGRSLDCRFRLPPDFVSIEHDLRSIAGRRFVRGNVQATLNVSTIQKLDASVIDERRLEAFLQITDALVAQGRASLPRADGLLALRGVLDWGDEDRNGRSPSAATIATVKRMFEDAVEALMENRAAEGAHLTAIVEALVERIEGLTRAARHERSRNPDVVRRRIEDQVKRLTDQALDEQRLLQELALIAVKADVSEEIDRLEGHVASARDLLVKNEAVGRRFDFLTQEMHRESNTICSKSNAVPLTAIGLELKVAVDQLREQVQNIE